MSNTASQALILAAGRGSRMGSLTEDAPKCAVKLNGYPLIYWQVKSLRAAGINKVAVVTGYQDIFFQNLPCEIDHIYHNPEWSESNMVWSLLAAQEYLSEPTIVSYSDIVYTPDIVDKLSSADGSLSITCDTDWLKLWSRRFEDPLDDAETFKTDANGILTEIGLSPKGTEEIEAQYMGLLKFSPDALQTIKTTFEKADLKNMQMTSLLDNLIKKGMNINTVNIAGGWCEVDSEKDLEVAIEMLHNKEILQYN